MQFWIASVSWPDEPSELTDWHVFTDSADMDLFLDGVRSSLQDSGTSAEITTWAAIGMPFERTKKVR